MGKTYERNGVYYVDLRIQGRRIRKKAGTSKKLAELLLKDLELKAERGNLGFLDRKEITIKDFLGEFRQYSQANHRPASQARYRAVINNFLEFIQKETNLNRLRCEIRSNSSTLSDSIRQSVPIQIVNAFRLNSSIGSGPIRQP